MTEKRDFLLEIGTEEIPARFMTWALEESRRLFSEALVEARQRSGEFTLPKGYYLQWAGQYENQVRAMERLRLLIPLCLLIDFVLLYLGFNRWWVALLVFAGIFVSASGGFITSTNEAGIARFPPQRSRASKTRSATSSEMTWP